MRGRRPSFAICFIILLILNVLPAVKLYRHLARRLAAYEYQTRVDLKSERIGPLLASLRGLREKADDPAFDSSHPDTLLSQFEHPVPAPVRLAVVDSSGLVFAATTSSSPSNSEHFPTVSNLSGKPMLSTASVGNVIRGLEGFSLRPYPGLDETSVYGAWMWDRSWKIGLIAETPADWIDQSIAPKLRKVHGLRMVGPAVVMLFYVLILLGSAWLVQWVVLGQSHKAEKGPSED